MFSDSTHVSEEVRHSGPGRNEGASHSPHSPTGARSLSRPDGFSPLPELHRILAHYQGAGVDDYLQIIAIHPIRLRKYLDTKKQKFKAVPISISQTRTVQEWLEICEGVLSGRSLPKKLKDKVSSLIKKNEQGYNVFLRPNYCYPTGRTATRDADTRKICSFFLDLDGLVPEVAIPRVQNLLPPPSLIVSSGGGTHFYWFLTEPLTARTIKGVSKSFVRLMATMIPEVDKKVFNASRGLRLPGTVNQKRDRPCLIVESHPDRKYHLQDLLPPEFRGRIEEAYRTSKDDLPLQDSDWESKRKKRDSQASGEPEEAFPSISDTRIATPIAPPALESKEEAPEDKEAREADGERSRSAGYISCYSFSAAIRTPDERRLSAPDAAQKESTSGHEPRLTGGLDTDGDGLSVDPQDLVGSLSSNAPIPGPGHRHEQILRLVRSLYFRLGVHEWETALKVYSSWDRRNRHQMSGQHDYSDSLADFQRAWEGYGERVEEYGGRVGVPNTKAALAKAPGFHPMARRKLPGPQNEQARRILNYIWKGCRDNRGFFYCSNADAAFVAGLSKPPPDATWAGEFGKNLERMGLAVDLSRSSTDRKAAWRILRRLAALGLIIEVVKGVEAGKPSGVATLWTVPESCQKGWTVYSEVEREKFLQERRELAERARQANIE